MWAFSSAATKTERVGKPDEQVLPNGDFREEVAGSVENGILESTVGGLYKYIGIFCECFYWKTLNYLQW